MKAKLLLMLFLVSLGLGAFASERHKKPHARLKVADRVMTRAPFDPSVQVEDINDCLYLTFQFSLYDAEVTILDRNGSEVIKEQQTIIYEGCNIIIPMADAYPYSIQIISPTMIIQGEIVLK